MPKQKSWDDRDPSGKVLSRWQQQQQPTTTAAMYSSNTYQSFHSHNYSSSGSGSSDPLWRTDLNFVKRLVHHRPFWWIVAAVLIYLCIRIPYDKSVPKTTRSRYPPPFVHEYVEYQDTTQSIDYQLLQKLLYNQNDAAARQSISAYQHHPMILEGHSAQEILDLIQQKDIPQVTVTAVVHYTNNDHFSSQFKAITSQSVHLDEIWVICDTNDIEIAKHQQQLRGENSRVRYILGDRNDLFQLSLQSSTDLVWIVDDGIVPGKRYLELLLRLSVISEYENALLGSRALSLSHIKDDDHCIFESGRSHTVDVILGQWLLRRSWLSNIVPSLTTPPEPSLLGYHISKALSQHVGAPLIYVPTSDLAQDFTLEGLDTGICKHVTQHLEAAKMDGTAWQEMPFQNDATKSKVAFIVDNIRLLDAYTPLICKFPQHDVAVNLVFLERGQDLHFNDSMEHLRQTQPECANAVVGHRFETDTSAVLSTQTVYDLAHLLSAIRPAVTIHDIPKDWTEEGIELARKVAKTVVINLPGKQVAHALWMAELPLNTLKEWHSFTVKLVVVTDRKPHSLARLIRSAARAHFLGDEVDLSVIMEQSSDRVTRAFVNSLPWPYGKKELRHRVSKVNHMPVYVESWYPSGDDEYAIILDEGLELSPNFYEWAKYAILKYRYSPGLSLQDTPMFGISLYTPRLVESDPNGRRLFNPAYQLEPYGYHIRTPFLMQSPTTSGSLYFPEYWREFHDYITARITDISGKQLQNITLPNIRSSQWVNSWRRYLDELIYMRGYVMLYPNFPNYASLSTNHFELGQHVVEDYSQVASVFRVPLLETDAILNMLPEYRLPEWDELPTLDMWGNVEDLDTLWQRGTKFQQQVSACAPQPMEKHLHDPSDLLCPFAKLITIPVNSEEDPVPEFSTRHIVLPTQQADA